MQNLNTSMYINMLKNKAQLLDKFIKYKYVHPYVYAYRCTHRDIHSEFQDDLLIDSVQGDQGADISH